MMNMFPGGKKFKQRNTKNRKITFDKNVCSNEKTSEIEWTV